MIIRWLPRSKYHISIPGKKIGQKIGASYLYIWSKKEFLPHQVSQDAFGYISLARTVPPSQLLLQEILRKWIWLYMFYGKGTEESRN